MKKIFALTCLLILSSCTDPEKIKKEIDDLYTMAKSLPASDACGNLYAYTELQETESAYETFYYRNIAREKRNFYKPKCEYQINKSKAQKIFETNYSLGENLFLMCDPTTEKITSKRQQRSQPAWIVTGDYYGYPVSESRMGWSPSDWVSEATKIFIHLSKTKDSEEFQKYQYFVMLENGIIWNLKRTGITNGRIFSKPSYYALQGSKDNFEINRETLNLQAHGTASRSAYHSSIGDFKTEANWYSSTKCNINSSSDDNWLENIWIESNRLIKERELKNEELTRQRQEELKRKEEEQKKKNII
tara:strand:+ start:106 stop:1014 length:909 start_codon:yes stop_codon:yes gene_type:complete